MSRLALWCEEHGLTRRTPETSGAGHVARPGQYAARGLPGLVAYHGKWESPAEVGKRGPVRPGAQRIGPRVPRAACRVADTPDAQLKLAAWCREKGLKEQATAHYTEVTRLDPSREIAWKHLGYKKQGHRWVKPDEAAAEKLEAEHQKRADSTGSLGWRNFARSSRARMPPGAAKAAKAMAAVTDPRAVPMIAHVLGAGNERRSLRQSNCLGKSRGRRRQRAGGPGRLEPVGPGPAAGDRDVLALRDPRDVVGRLITLVRRPYKYEVRLGNGPGSVGELLVDGEQFDLRRLYRFPTSRLSARPRRAASIAWSGQPGARRQQRHDRADVQRPNRHRRGDGAGHGAAAAADARRREGRDHGVATWTSKTRCITTW